MQQPCSIHHGIMVGAAGITTTLGTTHGTVIHVIRGMIGIGISATVEAGV